MDSDLVDMPSWSKRQTETNRLEEALIYARFAEIEAMLLSGRLLAARDTCANLLFEFQPAFATNTQLYTRFLALLERARARHLKQRLVTAVSGAFGDQEN
jgi:hypothetical protein